MQPHTRVRVVLLAWTAGIVVVSLVSVGPTGGVPIWNLDKVGHFLAYTGLSVLVLLAFGGTRTRILSLLGAIALGAALEFIQQFVPGRDMSLVDGIVNAAGVMTGAVIFRLFEDKVRRLAGRLLTI